MGSFSAPSRRGRHGAPAAAQDPASAEPADAGAPATTPLAGLALPGTAAVLARSADAASADPLGGRAVTAEVDDTLRGSRGRGHRLPEPLAADLAGHLGHDLSAVRVHTDGAADTLARSLQATAFTSGSDVYFRASAYDPQSERGQRLLTHELTHVVQNSRAPGAGSVPMVGRADDPAEAEADRSADRVVSALRRQASRRPAEPLSGEPDAGAAVRRQSSLAALRRTRAPGDASPVTNDDLELELFGVDKQAGEFTPGKGATGKLYIGSPGEGFWGSVKLDANAPGPVTVEGGFLQKLVVNDVCADYGTGEDAISFAEDEAAPHKDPPRQDGAWTYESDQPVVQTVKPGAEGTWEDLDRPLAAFPVVEGGQDLTYWATDLQFETVFMARVKDADQPWTQVDGKWSWDSSGNRTKAGKNEVESIEISTQKSAPAWDPEQVRALPHANGLPQTWQQR